ncbi:MAG TPA: hypothetical protein VK186_08595, partial [Candidatus Deferrimicrobium sp.]|nr:hypothetical protein [Candidatus Deferrimicrobium sp.]
MDNLSNELYSELKQIFLGGLEQPQTSWLLPLSEPYLDIYGENVIPEGDNFCLDFGTVSPLDAVQRTLFISNLAQQQIMVWVKGNDEHIAARFPGNFSEIFLSRENGMADLTVTFHGSAVEEKLLNKGIILVAEMENGTKKEIILNMRIHTILNFPYAEFNFDFEKMGSIISHDFGIIDPTKNTNQIEPYRLLIKNIGKETLSLSLNNLPPWLVAEMDGPKIQSPGGEFGIAPGIVTDLTFRPLGAIDFLGQHKSEFQLDTNDIRIGARNFNFQFSLVQEINGPYVALGNKPNFEVVEGGKRTFKIQLLNWGNKVALVIQKKNEQICITEDVNVIPTAYEGKPGKIELPAIFDSKKMPPGVHMLEMELALPGCCPEKIIIPITASIIGINAYPGKVDFGFIDPGVKSEKKVEFKASDGRELCISAKPVPELKKYLKVSVVNSSFLEIEIQTNEADIFLSPYDGPGIVVQEPMMAFHSILPIRFGITYPQIEVEPGVIRSKFFKGMKNEVTFEIRNVGNRHLEIEVAPKVAFLNIKGEKNFNIESGGKK